MLSRPLAFVLVLLGATPAAAAVPVPEAVLQAAERAGSARVLVRLAAEAPRGREAPAERTARRDRIARAADAALAQIGPSPPGIRRYGTLPLLALEASPRELEALAAAESVVALELDRPLVPSLIESIPRIGANVSASAGFDGSGTAIAVLDTGVQASHPFFGGRVVAEACFSQGEDCPNGEETQFGPGSAVPCTYGSQCWHGTHVAGIAAGSDATRRGVAPGAALIAIQVGSRQNSGCGTVGDPCVVIWDSDALAALDYVADTLSGSWNIASVNMSFGSNDTWSGSASCDSSNGAYKVAFEALAALGIASVAAAGNGSVTTGISAPACVSSAIAVGATIDTGEQVWVKSNSGPPLDLWAPGTNITSSVPGGGFSTQTGTSMATPHVGGAFAALRQADAAASVATLKLALESTGLPVTDTRNNLVRPRIQVDDAVRSRAPAACFDGLDNDGDGRIDVDGDGGTPDPDCTDGFDTSEAQTTASSCGIGPELALFLPLLGAFGRRRSRRAA
jgi:subtilisin family serine protease